MNRRVLIVSPHFPPVNAPDHQRVRMSLPYFEEFGWESHVLAVQPDSVEGVCDPLLEQAVPNHVSVIRTGALPVKHTRRIGLGSLSLRAFPHLLKAGNWCLTKQKFDLIYFSTTAFVVMALGPKWRSRFGIPYVLDFQDPWLSDYYKQPDSPQPPGGKFKYGFSQIMAQMLEPRAMRQVSHVISVSPRYVDTFRERYAWLKPEQFTVLPFGAAETDFALLKQCPIQQSYFNPSDGKQHWVYVGRASKNFAFTLRCLFRALAKLRQREPQKFSNLMLHFIGTDYAPGNLACKTVEPIAQECGVGDIVREHPQRIPYFEALQCLLDANALIVPGSDDPGYTASKIYPYILAQKPLLAIFHEESSVVSVLKATKAGTVITFKTGEETDRISEAIAASWLCQQPQPIPNTDWSVFSAYTAREMTRKQCAIFDRCLELNTSGKK